MKSKLCIVAAGLGLALVVLSLMWGMLFPPEDIWTVDKSRRMSELTERAHLLHIKVKKAQRQPLTASAGQDAEEYRKVTEELAALKLELESAKSRPETMTLGLRWGGLLLTALGLVGFRLIGGS